MHTLQPEQWTQLYGKELYKYAVQRLRNTDDSEDVVQETFLTAWRTREKYRGDVSERNWMYLILRSRIVDLVRKRKDNTPFISDESNEEVQLFDAKGHWLPNAVPQPWTLNPEHETERKEFEGILNNCLNKLPDSQRQVFVSTYIDGCDSDEIRQVLGITASNLWVLLHRARHKLRKCIDVHL